MSSISLPGRGRSEEPEWTVWLTVLISLLIGWVIMSTVIGRVETVANVAGGSLTIPASWIKTKEEGAAFAATDFDAGSYGSRVAVRQVPKADLITAMGPDTLDTAAANWSVVRGQNLEGYRILRIEPVKLQGRDAVAIEYAYLTDPPEGTAGAMPGLMHAIDTVVASGDQFAILTVAVDQSGGDDLLTLNSRLQNGWQVP
jgi:hypothetical protein